MKPLPTPPDAREILSAMISKDPEAAMTFITARPEDHKGRYLHWEKLKRLPPPDGLTPEQYWAITKLSREKARREIPLSQKAGNAFWFTEPRILVSALRDLDMTSGGSILTRGHELNAEDQRRYLARSLVEEPFSSSVLEGAATTRQAAREMIESGKTPRTRDERMVLNNYNALRFVKSLSDTPLTPELILEVHHIVTVGTLDSPEKCGVLRDDGDDITVQDEITGDVLHIPPDAASLPARLEAFCAFANADHRDGEFIHPILKAIILHFMIGYDHPFVDGNGRTARALFYWYVLKADYWLLEYVSISKTIMEAPVQYGRAYLETESDDGDLTYFLIDQVNVLKRAVAQLFEYAERRKTLLDQFAGALRDESLNHRQTFLLNDAARGRVRQITIVEHQRQHGVSYLTARADLEDLVERRLFRKKKQGRTSLYISASDLVRRLGGEEAPQQS